jgi:hypothetical protein
MEPGGLGHEQEARLSIGLESRVILLRPIGRLLWRGLRSVYSRDWRTTAAFGRSPDHRAKSMATDRDARALRAGILRAR